MRKILFIICCVLCCVSCSDDKTEINENGAQQIYNNIKGTYAGNIMVDNIPQKIFVTIGNDFTIKQLPLKIILQRIFTKESELDQALFSSRDVVFKAPTDQMAISNGNVYLTMEPTDFVFTVTVNEQSYQVTALIEAVTYIRMGTYDLSLNMDVVNLYCNGKSYDVSTNRINYFIDNAQKQE